jgi:hypothetical protein
MVAGYHPEDRTQRVLAMAKNNLARLPASICYRLEPVREDGDYHQVVWGGTCEVAADQLTDPALAVADHDGPAVAEARQLIRELLPGPDTTMFSKDFVDVLVSYGVSKDAIKKARIREGVVAMAMSRVEDGVTGWKVWRPGPAAADGEVVAPAGLLPP